ncbi:MAG TPA: DUF6111 family protein [Xanthobacteraceae bacterium]|nr:DUF6111 family protein [Xanthobacteraceae bacterium]
MIRPVLTELVLFLIPFAAYAGFLWATRTGIFDPPAWSVARMAWLLAAAVSLMIAGFVTIAQLGGSPAGSTYLPARLENGKISPGQAQ